MTKRLLLFLCHFALIHINVFFYIPDIPMSLSGSLVYQNIAKRIYLRVLQDIKRSRTVHLFVSHRQTAFILWLELSLFAEWKPGLKSDFSWFILSKLLLRISETNLMMAYERQTFWEGRNKSFFDKRLNVSILNRYSAVPSAHCRFFHWTEWSSNQWPFFLTTFLVQVQVENVFRALL